jgi:hypothetical protein
MDIAIDVNNLSAPLLIFMNEVLPLPLLNPCVPRLTSTASTHTVTVHANVVWLLDLGTKQVLARFAAKEAIEDVASTIRASYVAVVREKFRVFS